MPKTSIIVDYYATSPLYGRALTLVMKGAFQGDKPVFNSHLDLMEFPTFLNHTIELAAPAVFQALQDDYFYVLDPLVFPVILGPKRESVFVYMLFDMTAPK